ncbi:flagellar protein FliT [Rossellomorea aquimaris]|uniref:flagellar protein FliT n=1 Tax=Rossellomorea aquimaris TaxID=189382 RepID=UPI001CD44760|nr:flagellar protein FliT [Rossellomorea aquimaris]MCA1055314.1 flagellar protein FliT [Rossellomorea aquimaris]
MSSVILCHSITKQLLEAIDGVTDENRDSVIEKIEKLLVERQSLLGAINPPFTENEQAIGKQMMGWNQEIDGKLMLLRAEIKRDMNGLTKKKTSAQKYTNPYENLQHDGMFYDKKK